MLNLQQIVQQQTNTTLAYTQYSSKKQLLACSTFTAINAQLTNVVTALVNCFCFALHNSNKYLVITLYYTATKSYNYYVVCTATCNVLHTANTIKLAKQFVTQHIANNATVATNTTTNATVATTATTTKK